MANDLVEWDNIRDELLWTKRVTEDDDTNFYGRLLEHIDSLAARIAQLEAELSCAVGYMENARIDLQIGCSKATATKTLSGGIEGEA